jgi:predicted nucleotidyltransferase
VCVRDESVQELVGSLVERFLAEQGRPAPALAPILAKLREYAPALRARGVTGLWLFGSLARGDARADSDIDLFADFDPASRLSLVGLASLRADLSDLLGAPTDLIDRGALRPAVREVAEREAVRVLRCVGAPGSDCRTSMPRPKMPWRSLAVWMRPPLPPFRPLTAARTGR